MRLIDADALKKDILGLRDCYNGFSDTYDKACIIGVIDEQPTAQPESRREWYMKGYREAQDAALHESCTDCPLYDHDRHMCPRFNKVIPTTIQEIMDAHPERKKGKGRWNAYYHGEENGKSIFSYSCNQCGYSAPYNLIGGVYEQRRWNFCPNCGADMRGGE